MFVYSILPRQWLWKLKCHSMEVPFSPFSRRSVALSWMGHSCLKRVYRHSFIRNPLTTKHFNTIFFRVSQTCETRKARRHRYRALDDAPQDFERGCLAIDPGPGRLLRPANRLGNLPRLAPPSHTTLLARCCGKMSVGVRAINRNNAPLPRTARVPVGGVCAENASLSIKQALTIKNDLPAQNFHFSFANRFFNRDNCLFHL